MVGVLEKMHIQIMDLLKKEDKSIVVSLFLDHLPLPGRTGPQSRSRLHCLSHWPRDGDQTRQLWDLRQETGTKSSDSLCSAQ